MGSLVALDAISGKEIWVHEGLRGINSRGSNHWESKDHQDRRLIFSVNSFLTEIDANTGLTIMAFRKDGVVNLREGLEREVSSMGRVRSQSSGKIFENLVILSSAPSEEYVSPPGDVRAYVVAGKLVWQFHTVPHPGEPFYDTFPKDAWKHVGGVNTWGDLTVDFKNGIAFSRLVLRPTTSTERIERAQTYSGIVYLPWMLARGNIFGIFKPFTAIFGIMT